MEPRRFTQKHYAHAADEVANSTTSKVEKMLVAKFLIAMFAMDGRGKFKEGPFLKACGFGDETVATITAELNDAHDILEDAAGRKCRR